MNDDKKRKIESLQQQMRWSKDHLRGVVSTSKEVGDAEIYSRLVAICDRTIGEIETIEAEVQRKVEDRVQG